MQVLMNVLYGNQLAVLAETMALCRKSGVDKQQLLSVLQSSDLASPFLVEKAESKFTQFKNCKAERSYIAVL